MKLALAGDTMLGRGVAEVLRCEPPESLFAPEIVELTRAADLFILNLECCISERGTRWPAPGKPFFFRAPPVAIDVLLHLGVGCVTLANNHALDYGHAALRDTLSLLQAAGIATVGAGASLEEARKPAVLPLGAHHLAVIGVTDHPADFAAGTRRSGVAYADLEKGVPEWLRSSIQGCGADDVLVLPHWGPNMTPSPVPHVRAAARELVRAGATLVAGHSAHVFHGVQLPVLFDLGDFIDDYAVDPYLRNDHGLLFVVSLGASGPERLDAYPLRLEYAHTRLANEEEASWIGARFRAECAALGTQVEDEAGHWVVRDRASTRGAPPP